MQDRGHEGVEARFGRGGLGVQVEAGGADVGG